MIHRLKQCRTLSEDQEIINLYFTTVGKKLSCINHCVCYLGWRGFVDSWILGSFFVEGDVCGQINHAGYLNN